MFKAILPLLLVSSNAFAGVSCFVATDTSKMTADIRDENTLAVVKTEQIISASLKIEVGSKMYNGTVATLDVQTASGLHGSSLSGLVRQEQRFQVECDGGSMSVTEIEEGIRLVKADGLRADIQGCDGTIDINTAGTTFDQVACEAPKAH